MHPYAASLFSFGILASLGLSTGAHAQADETSRILDFLDTVQERSLDAGREYCGYLFRRGQGELRATTATRGEEFFCIPDFPAGDDVSLVASYHTHGTFSPEADSEVPSIDDILGDREEAIDGYIATPGGRVWLHEVETGRIEQVCGLGCLIADPNHDEGANEPVATSYTFDALKRRFFFEE